MIQWLIQLGAFADEGNVQKLIYILQEMDQEVLLEKYIPFGGMDYSRIDPEKPVIFYGSINMIRDVQNRFDPDLDHLFPFAWCDFDKFKCSSYYVYFGKYLLQQNYGFYPVLEIVRQQDFIYNTYGVDNKIFVRPDGNDKSFNGQVVKKDCLNSWYQLISNYGNLDECLALVCKPVKIDEEYRFFVKNDRIITASKYLENGMLETGDIVDTRAYGFVETVLKSVDKYPAPIYVIDIGKIAEDFFVVEIGPINCAGFYKADIRSIVKAMLETYDELH